MTKATTALSTDAGITKAILSVHKRSKTLQMDIQKVLVAIGTRWAQTKDMRPAVAHVNQLLTKGELSGMRCNSIREWVETFMGLVHSQDTKLFICPPAVTDGQHIDLKTMIDNRWWEFDGGEKPYMAITDPDKLLAQLIGKMQKDRTEMGDASKVSLEMIAALQLATKAHAEPAH